ncbi:hypothetical protein B0H14DRAFT_2558531 [Mycena olivaceomarginata]|nr:hypothetical protein B0H14DRAFT_2558531 [Mycena olivaceomarginata]
MAKAKSRKRDNDATEDASRKKKRGQPSDFTGATHPGVPRCIKDGRTCGFLAWVCQLLDVFPLPFDQDPGPDTLPPAPLDTAEDTFVALGLNLTPEEEQKSKIQMKTKGLWHHNDSIAPRRPSDFQFYMRHDDYKDAVMQQYIERYGDQPKDKQLALHCKVAIKMLAEEPDKVKEWLVAECDAAHAEDLEVFKEKEEPEPDADEEIQRKCHENFLPIVQPLLAGLHAYTGLTLNIIGGRINEETQQFKTMRYVVEYTRNWSWVLTGNTQHQCGSCGRQGLGAVGSGGIRNNAQDVLEVCARRIHA